MTHITYGNLLNVLLVNKGAHIRCTIGIDVLLLNTLTRGALLRYLQNSEPGDC